MKNRLLHILIAGVCMTAAFHGCQNLEVDNLNNPDEARALATPNDIESLIGGSFLTWFDGVQGSEPSSGLAVASDTYTCSWGNFGMSFMSQEPRVEFNNTTAFRRSNILEEPWFKSYGAISAASDGIRNIENGTVDLGSNNERAIAFGKLVQGLSHGFLAIMFDQGFILDEDVDLAEDVLELRPYPEVMAAAIAQLEEAIQIAGANTFIITPAMGWVFGTTMTNDDLVKLAHTFIARYMVAVARNPQDRAAVDWNTVLSHVDRGLTEEWGPVGDAGGRGSQWFSNLHWYSSQYNTWYRLDYKLIGPSDRSDGYSNWLSRATQDRDEFEMDTGDLRIWDQTRNADGDQNPGSQAQFTTTTPYDAGPYHRSRYGHDRFADVPNTNNGAVIVMYRPSEADFLRAEALLHQGGSEAEIAALLDKTHVTDGGYPSTAGIAAGGINDDPDPKTDSRTLWSVLKYERMFDLLGTFSGLQFWDKRGWEDLTTGTPIHFPVPALDLETLQLPIYTFGADKGDSAPKRLRPVGNNESLRPGTN